MNKQLVIIAAIFLGFAMSCKNQTIMKGDASLKSESDSVSYALGIAWAMQVKNMGLEDLNYAALNKAMQEVFDEANEMKQEEAGMFLNNYFSKLQDVKSQKNLEEGRAFLEENKNKNGIYELSSGIQYEVLLKGEGEIPTLGQQVKAHYTGTLLDGTKFDSSLDRGEPFTFTVGQGVIQGWSEIVQHMNVGSKYRVYIPTELAYGTRVRPGGPIEANMALIFEIELIEIVKSE